MLTLIAIEVNFTAITMITAGLLCTHSTAPTCFALTMYSNLIGQLDVHYFILMDLPRGLISRSNVVPPRVNKDVQYNSSHIPRPIVIATVAIF